MPEDLGDIAAALREGSLTAEALLDRCLARIAERDPSLNSFVAIDKDSALAAARDSDARLAQGAARSPLEGVPLSIKDNILVRGLPATWGSRALADFMPEQDELPVARLRAAGAVILGKTNVPELTLEGYTRNDLFGVTRNPWNRDLTPGGSSGGAAAGVAAGLVPAAIGTDGGGSIRRPASHTGLVGWKPSTGHMPRLWGFPAILSDFEVIGTLTRSLADARLLDSILQGPDPRDRRSLFAKPAPWPNRKPRVLYIPQFGAAPVDPEVASATQAFAATLAGQGAEVFDGTVFFDLTAANRTWFVISRAGVAYLMGWRPGFEAQAGTTVQTMAQEGRAITGADYTEALEWVTAFRLRLADLFTQYDLVLTPSAAALPWAADTPYPDRIDGREAGPRDHAIFTGWINLAGLPAISLPVAVSKERLPIGVQLVAGFGQDASLLAFAETIAGITPPPALPVWSDR
ncbi:amidase [Acidisoma cellulosilytica]|uniref:Amidase n=1 Tax=Acidisoma cellulosilyticum TaxID=2802395 RepID=A0A963Z6T0_9PROT|nr:amidase [Acidisoma cellulosilyticum]MCB8883556.1 amidase [Acidisoma cellulosilyticum]